MASCESYLDPIFTFRLHSGEVNCLKYMKLSECGAVLASGSSEGILQLWSLSSKRSIWKENVGTSIINVDACYVDREVRLISQNRSNCVNVWDIDGQRKVKSINIEKSGFCKFCTFQSLKWRSCIAASCQDSSKINVYDLLSEKIEMQFSSDESKFNGVCMCIRSLSSLSSGINYVLGGFENGNIVLWDERNPNVQLHSCQLFSQPVLSMTTDDVSRGAAGSVDTSVQFFNVSLEKGLVEIHSTVNVKNSGISDMAVRQDRKIFATGGLDGRIRVFTWIKGRLLAVINHHSLTVNCVQFAGDLSLYQDRNTLMCGSKDGTISVWKLY